MVFAMKVDLYFFILYDTTPEITPLDAIGFSANRENRTVVRDHGDRRYNYCSTFELRCFFVVDFFCGVFFCSCISFIISWLFIAIREKFIVRARWNIVYYKCLIKRIWSLHSAHNAIDAGFVFNLNIYILHFI